MINKDYILFAWFKYKIALALLLPASFINNQEDFSIVMCGKNKLFNLMYLYIYLYFLRLNSFLVTR